MKKLKKILLGLMLVPTLALVGCGKAVDNEITKIEVIEINDGINKYKVTYKDGSSAIFKGDITYTSLFSASEFEQLYVDAIDNTKTQTEIKSTYTSTTVDGTKSESVLIYDNVFASISSETDKSYYVFDGEKIDIYMENSNGKTHITSSLGSIYSTPLDMFELSSYATVSLVERKLRNFAIEAIARDSGLNITQNDLTTERKYVCNKGKYELSIEAKYFTNELSGVYKMGLVFADKLEKFIMEYSHYGVVSGKNVSNSLYVENDYSYSIDDSLKKTDFSDFGESSN